jgi:hypothetical protein
VTEKPADDTASLILPSTLSLSANGDAVSNKRQRGDTMATFGRCYYLCLTKININSDCDYL